MEGCAGEGWSSAAEVRSRLEELTHTLMGSLYQEYLGMSRAARLSLDEYREVLQETALEALADHLHDPGKFDPRQGKLEVWLYFQARNFLKAELRARLSWIASLKKGRDEVRRSCPVAEGTLEFAQLEDRLCLEQAMAFLKVDEAEAIHLHHALELPVVDVAEAMQRTLPETQWLLRRGRRTLKDRLEGREPRKPGRPRNETGGTS